MLYGTASTKNCTYLFAPFVFKADLHFPKIIVVTTIKKPPAINIRYFSFSINIQNMAKNMSKLIYFINFFLK